MCIRHSRRSGKPGRPKSIGLASHFAWFLLVVTPIAKFCICSTTESSAQQETRLNFLPAAARVLQQTSLPSLSRLGGFSTTTDCVRGEPVEGPAFEAAGLPAPASGKLHAHRDLSALSTQ